MNTSLTADGGIIVPPNSPISDLEPELVAVGMSVAYTLLVEGRSLEEAEAFHKVPALGLAGLAFHIGTALAASVGSTLVPVLNELNASEVVQAYSAQLATSFGTSTSARALS